MLGKRSWESTVRNWTNPVADGSFSPGAGFEEQYILLLEDVAKSIENALNKISALEKFVSDYKARSLTIESSFIQLKRPKLEPHAVEQSLSEPEVVEINDEDDSEEVVEKDTSNLEVTALESTDLNLNNEGVDQSKENNNLETTNSDQPHPEIKESNLTLPQVSEEPFHSDVSLNISLSGPENRPKSREDTHSEKTERYEIYVDNLDTGTTESEVREVFEKEGFQNLVVSIHNRKSFSFGFVRFQNEEDFNRVLRIEKNLYCRSRRIRFRDAGTPRSKSSGKSKGKESQNPDEDRNRDRRDERGDASGDRRPQQSYNQRNKYYDRARDGYSRRSYQGRHQGRPRSRGRPPSNSSRRSNDHISPT